MIIANTNNSSFMTGLTAATVQNAGAFINSNGFNISIGQTLSDYSSNSGSLAKVGAGSLRLTANNTYSGMTSINAGTLLVDGIPTGSGGYIVQGSAILAGTGTIANGTVTVNANGILAPGENLTGGLGAIGTLNIGTLALANGANVDFDLTTSTAPGGTSNDLVNVTSSLALTGTTAISISSGGATLANGNYTLFSYAGTALLPSQSSQFSLATPGVLNTRQHYGFDTTTAGAVLIDITGASANLNWNAVSGSAWTTSTASTNWLNTGSGSADLFANGDNVTFTSGTMAGTVSIVNQVGPGSTTVTGGAYTFVSSSSGAIAGIGALTVQSPATLLMATTNANTYTGGTFLQGGAITLGANNALPTAGTLTIGAFGTSGTLDLAGFSQQLKGLGTDPSATALNQVITASTGNSTLTFSGGATPSQFAGTIQDVGTLNLTVSAGTLDLTGASTTYHGATAVNGNGTLVLSGNLPNTSSVSTGAGSTLLISPSGNLTFAPNISNSGTFTLLAASSGTLTVPGVISGAGLVNFNGNSGTIVLSASNTFTAQAAANVGTLVLASTAALPAVGANVGGNNVAIDLATDTPVIPFNFSNNGTPNDTIIVDRATNGPGIKQTLATLTFGSNGTLNLQAGANVNNSGGTLEVTSLVLNGNPSTVTLNPTSGVMQIDAVTGAHSNTTLVLGGSSVGNVYTGKWTLGVNADNLTKSGNGSWTITGTAGYNGTTTVNGGTLTCLTPVGLSGPLVVSSPNFGVNPPVVLNLATTASTTVGSLSGPVADPFDGNAAIINTGNSGTTFTVNQSAVSEFDGTIAGPGNFTLSAASSGSLTLGGTSTYTGTTSLLGGSLVVGFNGQLSAPTAPLFLNNSAALSLNSNNTVGSLSSPSVSTSIDIGPSANLTVNQTVPAAYAGSLTDFGNFTLGSSSTSTLTLSGTSTSFSGNVNVNGGVLAVTGNLGSPFTTTAQVNAGVLSVTGTLSGTLVQVNSGATLVGNGTIGAPLTLANGGILTPGNNGSGTLTVAGGQLTFGANTGNTTALNMSIGANASTINVTGGGVTVNGGPGSVAVNVTYASAPAVGVYKLISYTAGSISATDSTAFALNIGNRVAATLIDNTAGQSLDLNVTSFRFPVWSGSNSLNWNTSDTNWVLSSNTNSVNTSTQTQYQPNDFVEFSDYAASSKTSVTITGSNVSPSGVLFNNNTNNYTLVSGFGIGGAGSLIKSGSGTLTIATSNGYTGGTYLNAGVLNVNNAAALGAGVLTINGGKLDNTSGGLAMTANNPQSWNGNFEFLGSQNLSMGTGAVTLNPASGSSVTVTVDNNTFGVGPIFSTTAGLTKTGTGTLAITTGGGFPAYDSVIGGVLAVNAGTLQINTGSSAATTADFIAAGLTGGGTVVNGGGSARWLLVNSSESDTFSGTLANGGGGGNLGLELTGSGAGRLTVSGTNTYGSDTTVCNGTLVYSGMLIGNSGGFTVGSAFTNASGTVANFGTQANAMAILSGNISADHMTIGTISNTGAMSLAGAVYQTGGVLSLGQTAGTTNMAIGASASAEGYYKLSGGVLNTNEIDVGGSAANTLGVMDVTGGTINDTGFIALARGSTSSGVLSVTGGVVNFDTAVTQSPLEMGWNLNNTTVLNIGGGTGGALVAGPSTTNGPSAGGQTGNGLNMCATTNAGLAVANLLSGGTLQVNGVGSTHSTATTIFNFNGGTLKATLLNAGALFFNADPSGGNPNRVKNVTVYAGGGYIDNSGTSITIGNGIAGASGDGVSAITLTSSGSGYAGVPIVNITGGSGQNATAVANMVPDGLNDGLFVIGSISITSSGSYTVDPTSISFVGGGGSGASAFLATAVNAADGGLSLTGGLPVTGAGITTLSGTNTYVGGTRVNGGGVDFTSTLAMPATGAINLAASTALIIPVGGATGFATTGSGSGTIVGVLSGVGAQGTPISWSAGDSFGMDTTGGNAIYAGNISTSAGGALVNFYKTGANTLTLSGVNTYTGATFVNGGVLSLASSTAIPSGGKITFLGGTLQYSASNTLDYSTQIVNSTGAISIDTNGQIAQFNSSLASSNSGGLTESGSGTLILARSNNYLGNTTIGAGGGPGVIRATASGRLARELSSSIWPATEARRGSNLPAALH